MDAKWVPARVTFAPRPEIVWLNCAGVSFDAPFFDQTIAAQEGLRPRFVSGLDCEPEIDASATLAPAAFVFQMSRCGSTLFANCLRALDGAMVISEAQPVNAAVSADDAQLLRRLMRYLSQSLTGCERRLFFKFTSWNFTRLPLIRALFPSTPAIFLCRDPVEVMVSNLDSPSGWLEMRNSPELVKSVYGWRDTDPRRMSAEEFGARVLGQFCWMVNSSKQPRDLVLDYRDLTPAMVAQVIASLEIAVSAAEAQRIAAAFAFHSKDPHRVQAFADDSAAKRARATPHLVEMADRWAYPAYRRLSIDPA